MPAHTSFPTLAPQCFHFTRGLVLPVCSCWDNTIPQLAPRVNQNNTIPQLAPRVNQNNLKNPQKNGNEATYAEIIHQLNNSNEQEEQLHIRLAFRLRRKKKRKKSRISDDLKNETRHGLHGLTETALRKMLAVSFQRQKSINGLHINTH